MKNILSIHALSGCDTVSSIFGVGKSKLAKVVAKNPDFATKLDVFLDPLATEEELCANGKQIIASLYVPQPKRARTLIV